MPGVYLWAVTVFCAFWESQSSPTATDFKNLKTYLFTTNAYDRELRPVVNQSDVLKINVEFYLLAVNSLDERGETFKTTGFLVVYWKDEFLTWNATGFGNTKFAYFPQNNVWKPDLVLKNSNKEFKQLGDSSLYVHVWNYGSVRWLPFQAFESTCSIDITYFPYDKQKCKLIFSAWSYSMNQIILDGGKQGIYLQEYEQNSAWDVIGTSWSNYTSGEESTIIFEITLQRKPQYSLLNLVFPIFLLAVLDLFVFALPCESGEKVGYAVTVFLAFAVFLTIMTATFPQNSESVSYFAIFVVIQTTQSTLITLIALFMVRTASFGEDIAIPGPLLSCARLVKCKAPRNKIKSRRITVASNDINKKVITLEEPGNTDQHPTIEKEDADLGERYNWTDIVNALDVVFFAVFFLSFVVSTTVCFLLAQSGVYLKERIGDEMVRCGVDRVQFDDLSAKMADFIGMA